MELYKQYEFFMKENECIEKEQSKIRVAISNYENKKAIIAVIINIIYILIT